MNKLSKSRDATTQGKVSKIYELIKTYGNENATLVNPAENPYVLEVRDRRFEIHRQQE